MTLNEAIQIARKHLWGEKVSGREKLAAYHKLASLHAVLSDLGGLMGEEK